MSLASPPYPLAPTVRGFVPPIAKPLLEAKAAGQPLRPVLQTIVHGLDFDDFTYGVATSPRPSHDTRAYSWTSLPADWVRLYDERAYVEVDPRMRGAWESPLPYLWDRTNCGGSAAQREFFDAAADYGLASGVAVALRNQFDAPGYFVLSSALPVITESRRQYITAIVGQVMVLATVVHNLLLTSVIEHCLAAPNEGQPLSERERACLQLAAAGLGAREIGAKLQIGERTVNNHFANLLAKMGAATRDEAIAIASAVGLVAA
jgi:DNA-binding CsgD family transcriptional regulator